MKERVSSEMSNQASDRMLTVTKVIEGIFGQDSEYVALILPKVVNGEIKQAPEIIGSVESKAQIIEASEFALYLLKEREKDQEIIAVERAETH